MPAGSKFNLAICICTCTRTLPDIIFHSGNVQNFVGIHPTVPGEPPESPEGTVLSNITIIILLLTERRLQGTDVEGIRSFPPTSCGNPQVSSSLP
jgi:hypothetical protein